MIPKEHVRPNPVRDAIRAIVAHPDMSSPKEGVFVENHPTERGRLVRFTATGPVAEQLTGDPFVKEVVVERIPGEDHKTTVVRVDRVAHRKSQTSEAKFDQNGILTETISDIAVAKSGSIFAGINSELTKKG